MGPGWTSIALAAVTASLSGGSDGVIRVGDVATASGVVQHAPAHARAVLETRAEGSRKWTRDATGRVGLRGRFTLRWRVPPSAQGFDEWRVLVLGRSRPIAVTRPRQLLVGQRYVPCKIGPQPDVLPAGDGWIRGGLYIRGGPAPGIDRCSSEAYTIYVMSGSKVVTSTNVAGGYGYSILVPAGTYTLQTAVNGGCRSEGPVRVPAEGSTRADTFCDVP